MQAGFSRLSEVQDKAGQLYRDWLAAWKGKHQQRGREGAERAKEEALHPAVLNPFTGTMQRL
jgi:hypothetical protein